MSEERVSPSNVLATPAGFASGILGLKLYPWQREELNALEVQGTKLSTVCCNEAGKTSYLAGPAILWVMALFPGSQVVVTSGSWRQVREQLFPSLKRFAPIFHGWTFHDTAITSPDGSRCVGFSTDDAGLFEGFHVGPGSHRETPLLIIADEAKSIPEPIFEAIDRCRATWVWLMSSPGNAAGTFYKSQTEQRAAYRCRAVTVADCPHILQSAIDDIIQRYGPEHPFTRSSLYAEFTGEDGSGVVCTLAQVNMCIAEPPAHTTGDTSCWIDFAAGGDENVIALRRGNKITLERCWRETDTMRALGEFIMEFRRLRLKAEQITGDEGGLGKPMLDRLREMGWEVNRFNSGARAQEPEAYFNRGAEIWDKGSRRIDRRTIILPNDPLLIEQLTTRRWKRYSDGRLQLESKEEMRKRGLKSPDRADAVLGCMQDLHHFRPQSYLANDPFEQFDRLERYRENAVLAGLDAGG
ncbi:MAG: hypothetical protein JSS23_12245 [Proteobacteria bacterium]|nr:hypothetical protein [Pseudomonadota bacterium]